MGCDGTLQKKNIFMESRNRIPGIVGVMKHLYDHQLSKELTHSRKHLRCLYTGIDNLAVQDHWSAGEHEIVTEKLRSSASKHKAWSSGC